jgi:hypothetical protein
MYSILRTLLIALVVVSVTAGELKIEVTHTPKKCNIKAKAGDQVRFCLFVAGLVDTCLHAMYENPSLD